MANFNFLGTCPLGRVLQIVVLAHCIYQFPTCSASPPTALDQFLGKWLEVKKVGFKHFLDVLGVTGETRRFFEKSKTELTYSRDGDNWSIQVGIVGVPGVKTYKYKLGEPYSSFNIDGTPLKSVVRGKGSRLVERHESLGPSKFVMDIVREVVKDTMTATITVDGISMQTIFRRG